MTTRAEVIIDGDVGPLRKMLREGVSAMNDFQKQSGDGFKEITGPLEGIAKKFAGLVAIIGSGAIFKAAIDETIKFTKETNVLARTLGISATEASAWNVALGDIYQDSDALVGVLGKLNRVLAEDEDKLNKLGIATRDSNGNLKSQADLLQQVTGYLAAFKDGTDKNVEGAKIFGKSWNEVAPVMQLTAEKIAAAKEKADELGLTMTAESQGTVSAYRASMNDVGDVMLALKNAVAMAVMPVLTRLGEWFSSIGPTAVLVVKGAIGGLATAFMGLQTSVIIAWETIKSFAFTIAGPLRSLGEALFMLAQGDFKGATEVMMGWTGRVADRWSGTMATIVAESKRTAADIAALWGPGSPAAAAGGGGGGNSTGGGKKGAAKADPSQMAAFDAMLAKQKQILIEGGFIREYEAQQERAFWQEKLTLTNLSAEDRLRIERKVAQLSYEIRKREIDRARELTNLEASQAQALAVARIDTQQAAEKWLLDSDQITKDQFLRLEMQHEADKYQIQSQALQQRMEMLKLDPNMNPVEYARIKGELLLLEQQYERARVEGMNKLENNKEGKFDPLEGMAGRFEENLAGMLGRTKTIMGALANVFKPVGDAFIKHLVTEPLGKYLAGLARMLAMKMGFIAAETTAQTAGSAATVAIKGTETAAVAGANAVQAGTGAAASQASIPIVGPFLALAAMAMIFAAVSSMGSKAKKSAAGGYDIPSGINPVTQLHAEEMVLPAKYANAFRDMVAGGGAGGQPAGDTHHWHVNALDARSFEGMLRNGGSDVIVKSLQERRRSGAF